MTKTSAISGQRPRPALDAALAKLEKQAESGRCGVCGCQMTYLESFGGSAFWDGERMTPWMCPECARKWQDSRGT